MLESSFGQEIYLKKTSKCLRQWKLNKLSRRTKVLLEGLRSEINEALTVRY